MKHVDILLEHYPQLQCCAEDITQAIDAIVDMAANGAKLLLCGNGGSAADCSHIAGELLKGFLLKRPITNADRALLSDLPDCEALQRGICAISLPDQGVVKTQLFYWPAIALAAAIFICLQIKPLKKAHPIVFILISAVFGVIFKL